MGLQFQPVGTFSEENLNKLIKASNRWKSWCKEIINSEDENWPIIANLYYKDLVITVVEINSFLFYIPQLPVEDLLADCQVTGNYEETKAKTAEFYKEVIMLTEDRFLAYQDIFNRFVEFAVK